MATTGHTLKAFDDDLNQLRAGIAEMGGLAEAAIAAAMAALADRDSDAARQVVDGDRRIDAMETQIEALAVRIIALRAPMADDLREVVAALKVVGLIERIGDYAKNIAKRVPAIADGPDLRPLSILLEMGRIVAALVGSALDAFAERDPERAAQVCERDKAVDEFYNAIFRTLLTFMMESPGHITPSTHLLFVAKNLERIGDHATNIAERVHFAATGVPLGEREKGGDGAGAGER